MRTGLLVSLLLDEFEGLHAAVHAILAEGVQLDEHLLRRLPGGSGFRSSYGPNALVLPHIQCHGLRETSFYNLFSYFQVYKTGVDIQRALPLINDDGIALDGGILKPNGSFFLGSIMIQAT